MPTIGIQSALLFGIGPSISMSVRTDGVPSVHSPCTVTELHGRVDSVRDLRIVIDGRRHLWVYAECKLDGRC